MLVFSWESKCLWKTHRFDGQVSVFNYKNGPCYRCLYPSPPPPHLILVLRRWRFRRPSGIIGTLQVNEALKIILGIGAPLKGRFLLFDALKMEFNEMKEEKPTGSVERNQQLNPLKK